MCDVRPDTLTAPAFSTTRTHVDVCVQAAARASVIVIIRHQGMHVWSTERGLIVFPTQGIKAQTRWTVFMLKTGCNKQLPLFLLCWPWRKVNSVVSALSLCLTQQCTQTRSARNLMLCETLKIDSECDHPLHAESLSPTYIKIPNRPMPAFSFLFGRTLVQSFSLSLCWKHNMMLLQHLPTAFMRTHTHASSLRGSGRKTGGES